MFSSDLPHLERLLHKLDRPLPRYTSYPTAPIWESLSSETYTKKLAELSPPFSLYFHIPFCEKMCLFCGCSVVLNRKRENEERYVAALIEEIKRAAAYLPMRPRVTQLHFGGGTPTKLDSDLFIKLFDEIQALFEIDFSEEVAIEIDPRTIEAAPEKLSNLREIGFNRVSFGVQDIDPKVQEAILRRQSLEITRSTYHRARALGFLEVNLDLIYGLPYQTRDSFQRTIDEMIALAPDRIALFSYAKVPHLKAHQRAIAEETLPTKETKFQIYAHARQALTEAGYVAIGMDHFAKKESELTKSYLDKTLHRNFQGYTIKRASVLLGFGMSAISDLGDSFFQNHKELAPYYLALDEQKLPIARGKILSEEDLLRRAVIQSLMCRFEVDKELFFQQYKTSFDLYFEEVRGELEAFQADGLLTNTKSLLRASPLGELFIRNIAALFDGYFNKKEKAPIYSSSI